MDSFKIGLIELFKEEEDRASKILEKGNHKKSKCDKIKKA